MANKLVGKGTIFQLDIASTLTTIPQLTEVNLSGVAAQIVATPTLDGGVGIPHTPTGYTEGGSIDVSGYYDTDDSVAHQFITDLLTDPVTLLPCLVNLSYSDTTPFAHGGSIAGVEDFGTSSSVDGITTFNATFKLDGLLTWQ